MISDEDLDQLRYKGESADLDFKQAQYPFAGASDHEKSELLKDIMAMGNAYRSGPGYILIGFRDMAPHPAEVVGISSVDHIDDAALQQLVRSKIDPPLEFQYEERIFDGKHIAVITIPKQARPFAPRQDFGKLRRNVALVRRGSSTDEASLSEMTKMALADAGSPRAARVDLRIETEVNQPFPVRVIRSFLSFGELPDYDENTWIDLGNGHQMPVSSMRIVNRHYYRQAAEYHSALNRLIWVRLSLENQSDFAMGEAKLELTCSAPSGEHMQLLRSGDLPLEPKSGDYLSVARGFPSVAGREGETVRIDERARDAVCHVLLGTLRPGETGRAATDIALLPTGPGNYTLRVRILAKELAAPVIVEHAIAIEGQVRRLELEGLEALIVGKRLDEVK